MKLFIKSYLLGIVVIFIIMIILLFAYSFVVWSLEPFRDAYYNIINTSKKNMRGFILLYTFIIFILNVLLNDD